MTDDEASGVVLVVKDVSKTFVRADDAGASTTQAIAKLSLTERRGAFLSIVGPSGCGKTTLLKLIAGLETPTDGAIIVDGHTVLGPPGNAIYVFQEYSKSLLPWRTVAGNVSLGLESRGLLRAQREERVERYLNMVGLWDVAAKYPWELSGGMQQRAVVARALACEPAILLFDEPFGSLDAMNRHALEDKLLTLWDELHQTILFVTHDIDEAIYLSDRILVFGGPPAHIIADIAVDLQRPRDQVETRSSAAFGSLRKHVHHTLAGVK